MRSNMVEPQASVRRSEKMLNEPKQRECKDRKRDFIDKAIAHQQKAPWKEKCREESRYDKTEIVIPSEASMSYEARAKCR